MKKKTIFLIILTILIICLIPIPSKSKDNSKTEYKALLYKIIKYHQTTETVKASNENSLEIFLFGKRVWKKGITNIVINADPSPKSSLVISKIDNVTTSLSNITTSKATLTIKDTNDKPYSYYDWYQLEEIKDNTWYEVKPLILKVGFNDKLYQVDEYQEVKFDINWSSLYGKIKNGHYRIIKRLDNLKYIATEFDINKIYVIYS